MANLKSTEIFGSLEVLGEMHSSSTSYTKVPTGTTAQRPSTPENGMIRYNTDIDSFEGYQAGEWGAIGGGSVEPGTIVAYSPGYFTANDNSGFSVEGPSANTVAAVNEILPDEWRVCDGSEFLDAESSIWNVAGRHLPNLTDDRFIRGSSAAGAAGGSNQKTLSTPQLPVHSHTVADSDGIENKTDISNAPHAHPGSTGIHPLTHTHTENTSGYANMPHRHSYPQAPPDDRNFSRLTGQVFQGDSYVTKWTGLYVNYTNAPHQHARPSLGSAVGTYHSHSAYMTYNSVPHSHTGNLNTTDYSVQDPFSSVPNYLNIFYIIRVK